MIHIIRTLVIIVFFNLYWHFEQPLYGEILPLLSENRQVQNLLLMLCLGLFCGLSDWLYAKTKNSRCKTPSEHP